MKKNSLKKGIKNIKSFILKNKVFTLCVCLIIIIVFLTLRKVLLHELNHAYTADSPLYWAVGRGMLNGLMPYSEMYENKPLGIFLLSAISFFFTDDTLLCNIFTFLSLLVITFTPLICVYEYHKNQNTDNKIYHSKTHSPFLIALLSGTVLMLYCEERSGGFQVETIGTAFSLLYIWSIMHLKYSKDKIQKQRRTILTALFISLAVLMKEPFVLVAVAGAMLFIDSVKDFISYILIPGILGAIFLVLILFISGVLEPYISIYVLHMFSTRLSGESTLWNSAYNTVMLIADLMHFDWKLFVIIIVMLCLSISVLQTENRKMVIYHILRIGIMIYLASFCVAMGGQYYNHHFIFAAPIYGSFIICGSKILYELQEYKIIKICSIVGIIFLSMTIIFDNHQFEGNHTMRYEIILSNAKYVDSVLNYYGEERYQYLGFNGEYAFYGLTKHSPQGPVFAQDPDNFQTDDSWFSQKLLNQINNSNIIILDTLSSPAIDMKIRKILSKDFTTQEPMKSAVAAPFWFRYKIYYRKNNNYIGPLKFYSNQQKDWKKDLFSY